MWNILSLEIRRAIKGVVTCYERIIRVLDEDGQYQLMPYGLNYYFTERIFADFTMDINIDIDVSNL